MFTTAKDLETFMLAGNAIVTFESAATGNHFTYRVRQATDKNGDPTHRWFVSLLTGPNNDADYTYLGVIDGPVNDLHFRLTAKSKIKADAPSAKAFTYAWERVYYGKLPAQLHAHHEGRCGRCNRTLTVPESIERGIGPECWDRMQAA